MSEELDPLGESQGSSEKKRGVRSQKSTNAAASESTGAGHVEHSELLEQFEELQFQVTQLTLERDELAKRVAELEGGNEDQSGHEAQRTMSENVPRRMAAPFRVAGPFGLLTVEANQVVTDPDHIRILKAHDAPMVRA